MSITRTKRRFYELRARLEEVSAALDVAEETTLRMRDRMLLENGHLLRLLSGMLEVHASHPRLAKELRERIDSTLDERNRLTEMVPSSDL